MDLPTRYKIGDRAFFLEIGNYRDADGPICIQVWGEMGPETRLTINLPDFSLNEGEIFTKDSDIKWNRPHLKTIGFKYTGRIVNYGPYDAKAQVWKFSKD